MCEVYSEVYQALDASVAHSVCLASSEAQVQRALTYLRSTGRDPESTRQLEGISVVLQELALASVSRNQAMRVAAVERLRASAQDWMMRRPMC